MVTAYIGIGSNMHDKIGYCRSAVDLLDHAPGCRVKAVSSYYRTEPVGLKEQDWYVNAVAQLDTELPIRDLLDHLMGIEKAMGRKRNLKWDSRTLDLDILLYGSHVVDEENLIVPHPLMHLRRFVLVPLHELAPDLIHPLLAKSVSALLDAVPENGQRVTRLEEI